MSENRMTKAEALLNLKSGVPVDWSLVDDDSTTNETTVEAATETQEETAVDDVPEEHTEETAGVDVEESTAESHEEDSGEGDVADQEWEETILEAGGDPNRNELEEANQVLASNPVDGLKAEEAIEKIQTLSEIELMAVQHNDSRKSVQKAAGEALGELLEQYVRHRAILDREAKCWPLFLFVWDNAVE